MSGARYVIRPTHDALSEAESFRTSDTRMISSGDLLGVEDPMKHKPQAGVYCFAVVIGD